MAQSKPPKIRDCSVRLVRIPRNYCENEIAALKRDDVEEFYRNKPWRYPDVKMLRFAINNKARKCFKAILTEKKLEEWKIQELTSVFHHCIQHDYPCLKVMVDYGYRDVNQRLEKQGTPLHTAVMQISICFRTNTFLEHFTETIDLLLSMGARASTTTEYTLMATSDHCTPLDLALGCLHLLLFLKRTNYCIQNFLIGVTMLLDAMKKENRGELPVSLFTVLILQDKFSLLLDQVTTSSFYYNYYNHLDVYTKILEMVLKTGVNLRDKKQKTLSCLNPSTSPDEFFTGRLYTDRMHYLISLFGRDGQIFKYIMKFHMLMLTYGHEPDMKWGLFLHMILHYQPTALVPLVPRVLSIMDQELQYKIQKTDILMLAENLGILYTQSVSIKCHSLLELCRRAMYKYIKDGRMAAHVDKLEIPGEVKDFLLFK